MMCSLLAIKAIKTYGEFYREEYKVECPKGSGKNLTLLEVAKELTRRLIHIFEKNDKNERLAFGPYNWFYKQEENIGLVLFHEYFHGDTLKGLGASHQTGWTALIANLFCDFNEKE